MFFSLINVRSGNVDLNFGSLRNSDRTGNDWSRSAVAYGVGTWDARAHYLYFHPSGFYPSGNYTRWVGLPVRCLVY